ncbi:MAG TPA: NAD(P)/FAD-dependent oxidoreductase [Thermoleophilaceae bacterium]|nr:NAD(P)/FAD-dependent oxidoreductase [Thermoleophilaceae bacterium]
MYEQAGVPSSTGVAIVGSGFSGLAIAVELKRSGRDDFVVLERASDVAGTWRDNTYPGCACDVPSHLYSFGFAPNPDWSSTFSPQAEIYAYIRRVAEEQGLMPHIRFGIEVEDAHWDDVAQEWRLGTSRGEIAAKALVSAAGPLSEPAIPDIPGLSGFKGTIFHSATWDHDHDLTGERVAVIGTGASAIQFVPQIQPKVAQLHVFQRTPPWIMPRPDRPLTKVEKRLYRRFPPAQIAMRNAIYWGRELFAVPMLHHRLSKIIEKAGRRHLERQVEDPVLRAKLTPDYAPGCKRILVSNDYLPSLEQPNVEVVTDGIAAVREHSVVDRSGVEREVDTIILGTGFHVTDLPIAERVRGRDGRTLAEHWNGTLTALRGTTVAGFPNLFFVLGPNTGLGHTSVVLMAEAQAGYIRQALEHMDRAGVAAIEPRKAAQDAWNDEIQRKSAGTVWLNGGCHSWYIDRNGKNSTLWPDHTFKFFAALKRFEPAEYRIAPAAVPAPAPAGAPVEVPA